MPVHLPEHYTQQVSSDWFWETNEQAEFTYLSPGSERLLGRPATALIGRRREAIARADETETDWQAYRQAMTRRQEFRDFLYPYAHPNGSVRWFKISGEPRFAMDGAFLGFRGVGSDVSEQMRIHEQLDEALDELRQSNERLSEQNRRFDAALANMSQGLCMFDAASRLVVFNDRYREMFGLSAEALTVGMTQGEICEVLVALGTYPPDVTVDGLCEGTRLALAGPPGVAGQRELADGRVIAVSYRGMSGGGWVSTFEDITERRRNEARIAHMARHDALTNLPNRTALREHGIEMLGEGRCDDAPGLAMLCIDLDRFKAVNDTHGHATGDALLRSVAERLRASVREGDLVSRLGGDEFAVLHRAADEAGALALAQRLARVLSVPYHLNGIQLEIGASVGVAMATRASESVEELLQHADLALYHVKSAGRGAACVFQAAMNEAAKARHALERELREALAQGAFELHYQPLVDLGGGRITGMEALLRWRHPERGLVSPGTFIPLAEETGLIVPLGRWVLEQACRDAATWPAHVSLAVNVSAAQLRHRGFAEGVLAALEAAGIGPGRLELEMTETVLLEDTETNLETLHGLRRAGIRISMDDFGTGYSSLGYLRRFPFDKIKIDRSFVRDLDRAAEAGMIMRTLLGLGANLGIATLVEGIETRAQLEAVRAAGCRQVQGYLFSPPRPLTETYAMLSEPPTALAAA